jgi:hypothetical protein
MSLPERKGKLASREYFVLAEMAKILFIPGVSQEALEALFLFFNDPARDTCL